LDALCFSLKKTLTPTGPWRREHSSMEWIKEQGGAEPVRISALDAEISIARRRAIALF
jgi:hypothetical protein